MRFPFFRREYDPRWIWVAVAVGLLLRVAYLTVTPFDVRGHDASGHLEYINYVADTHSLPPPYDGFEYYQPPLYYALAAPVLWIAKTVGMPDFQRFMLLQCFSLALSAVTLLLGVRVGRELFPRKSDRTAFALFTLALAVTPAFVFFAARINNDVLYQVWAFASFLLLLQWWKKPDVRIWLSLCAVIGLGILTKTNMALMVLPAFVCLLFAKKMRWTAKAWQGLAGIAMIVIVAGWFHIPRALDPDAKKAVVGNYTILTNFVENGAANFLTFNPVGMLAHPYNDPYDDVARRQYFWEYLFRSSLYGEFGFGSEHARLAVIMLLSSLLLIPLVVANFVRDIRRNALSSLPVWSTLLVTLAGAALFRFVFPYSSSQDFRYSVLLLPLFAYYAVKDLDALDPVLRQAVIVLCGAFGVAATGFLLTL